MTHDLEYLRKYAKDWVDEKNLDWIQAKCENSTKIHKIGDEYWFIKVNDVISSDYCWITSIRKLTDEEVEEWEEREEN